MRGFRGFTLVELPVVRKGFTLIELVVVIAIIALLIAIVLPSLSRAKELARLACCSANLSAIGKSLGGYASENATRLPPFMFSSAGATDLLLSGHWGGTTNPLDPDRFGRDKTGAEAVNLWVLVGEQFLQREALTCPGADRRLLDRAASYFPYTDQFSTYCLRFPPSEDLFDTASALAYRYGGLLGIYKMRAGGQPVRSDAYTVLRVPQVFWGRRYRVNGRDFCTGADSLAADAFWMQGDYQPGGDQTAEVARDACHGPQYNVLSGSGGVRTVTDDGTIAENAVVPGEAPPSADRPYAEKAHILWTFFDDAK